MTTLDSFRNIRDTMLWKEAALEQLTQFEALAGRLGVPLTVAGSHTSKSISLPVVQLIIDGNLFLLRDNFNDVNLCVCAGKPVMLPLAEMLEGVCKPLDWNWYLKEISKCRSYTWDYFTDEEMDDPDILHVRKPHKASGGMIDWNVTRGAKDRWLQRMTDPLWYSRDWSHGEICWEGEFGHEATLFVQYHPFAEGLEKLVPSSALRPYFPGKRNFALSVNGMESAELIIRKVSRL